MNQLVIGFILGLMASEAMAWLIDFLDQRACKKKEQELAQCDLAVMTEKIHGMHAMIENLEGQLRTVELAHRRQANREREYQSTIEQLSAAVKGDQNAKF